jgi:predicted ATP-dependent endonuclease of OLD family
MILKSLSLANFRGFEQMILTFEPSLNVIAGIIRTTSPRKRR